MKTVTITAFVLLAPLVLAANTARADHRSVTVAFDFGPAYVLFHDGYRRVDRGYRNYYRHPRFRGNGRSVSARDLWHRCYDGRWYRYYDRKHRRHHEARKREHKHAHRHHRRYRHR